MTTCISAAPGRQLDEYRVGFTAATSFNEWVPRTCVQLSVFGLYMTAKEGNSAHKLPHRVTPGVSHGSVRTEPAPRLHAAAGALLPARNPRTTARSSITPTKTNGIAVSAPGKQSALTMVWMK